MIRAWYEGQLWLWLVSIRSSMCIIKDDWTHMSCMFDSNLASYYNVLYWALSKKLLFQGQADRIKYLQTRQAKIVAMTCTHAALKRREFLEIGFKYDNLIMEESAQILEIESFIPMLLQVDYLEFYLIPVHIYSSTNMLIFTLFEHRFMAESAHILKVESLIPMLVQEDYFDFHFIQVQIYSSTNILIFVLFKYKLSWKQHNWT